MRTVGALACSLACSLALLAGLLPAPSRAEGALRLDRPRLSPSRAELTGRAPSSQAAVRLERRVHGRWHRLADVAVRHGRFRTSVVRRARAQRFRVSVGPRHSQVRQVPARQRVDACGVRPRKTSSSYWACTFHDDFDGDSLDRSRWTPATAYTSPSPVGQGACYLDDPSVIAVSGGALHLTVRPLPGLTFCPAGSPVLISAAAAGMVSTVGLFSQEYGRFEARYRSAPVAGPGLQEAFWLWPDTRYGADHPWPASGEIDVAETYSARPDLAVPFLHYTADDNGGPVPGTNTAWDCRAPRGEWHTYTLEWSPTRLEIRVDGRSCLVNTSDDPAFDKRYVVNLTAALGVGENSYLGAFPLPATMDVDYVRVWR